MNEERSQILEMVGKGKITIEEAEMLLDALGAPVEDKASWAEKPVEEKGGNGRNPLLTPDQIVTLSREGVGREFLRAVKELHNVSGLIGEHIVAMGLADVSPDFIRAVAKCDLPGLTGDHVVRMGCEDVSPDFIKALNGLNVKGLTGEHIVEMAIEDVSPDFIRALEGLDVPGLTGDHMVAMARGDVSPNFIDSLKEMDLSGFSGEHIVEMALEDMDPHLLREMDGLW